MHFDVRPQTIYACSRPAGLGAHWLRSRPRSDATTELLRFEFSVDPPPAGRSQHPDLEGKLSTLTWFTGTTPRLEERADSRPAPGALPRTTA
jgi:Bacterial transglutaminase-like N-terminal region